MQTNEETTGKRVLVLGYDAATFDIMRPMIDEGKLPNFKRMMERGCHGDLQSTFPPVTPPAWASFMTGKNPGKHGVFNFYYHSPDPSKDDENYFVNAHSIKANALWEILSQKGKRNIVMNVPVTYPLSEHVNGIIISGLLTPNHVDDYASPHKILAELESAVGTYRVDSHPTTDWSQKSMRERLDHYMTVEEERTRAALHLLRNHPWDFFMVMFSFTDKILHLVYPHLNKDYPESRALSAYIGRTYEKADEILGRFLEEAGPETTVMVVSDHGFGSLEKVFVSNRWLLDQGMLNLRKATLSTVRDLYQVSLRRMPLDKLLMKLNLGVLRKTLPASLRERPVVIPRPHRRVSRSVVDWTRTRAYGSDYGIRINLRGRETCGIVEPGAEYESLRDDIIARLMELRAPDAGEPIVDRVWKREELFEGPYAGGAPDLMYIMKGIRIVQYDIYHFGQLFKNIEVGTHRMNGVFLVQGPGVKSGVVLNGAAITDAAPTIFHAMGLPVPQDMDGRVLTECFEEAELAERPVAFEQALPLLRQDSDDRLVYDDAEQEEIMRGLKGLGYFG